MKNYFIKLLFILSIFLSGVSLFGQTNYGGLPRPNSNVIASAKSGDTLYIGGDFTQFSTSDTAAQYGSLINRPNGRVIRSWPRPNSTVWITIPDGNGGWFIGGDFSQVGDSARQRVAHINNQGKVSAWKVKNCNNQVRALQLDGNNLYIGGEFSIIGDSSRNKIAMVNATTGAVSNMFNNAGFNSAVYTFTKNNNNLYVGGTFTNFGSSRAHGTILDTVLGNLLDINYPQANTTVWASVSDGNGGWFIGGDFSQVGDSARQRVAHINAQGKVSAWKVKNCNNSVRALELEGNNLYIGGYFTIVGDSARNRIVEVDATTGAITSKFNNGGFDGAVFSLTKNSKNIYAGGEFAVYGPQRNYGIMADTTYGNIVSQPTSVSQPNGTVWISIPDGNGGWFIGGDFGQVGDSVRQRVAHINAQGRVSSWKVKNCNSTVRALQLDGNNLYIGGDFTVLGDSTRNRVAEVDKNTGAVTNKFNTGGFNSTVWSFAKTANNLFVGGSFTSYGNSRTYGTVLDTVLGNLTNINYPQANSTVWASIPDGNGGWFIAGDFSQVGDSSRQRVAHINNQGKVSAWKVKNCNNSVRALELEGNSLYLGGYFTVVSDSSRNRIVEVDATTGAITSKFNNGGFDGAVFTFTKNNKNIYAGGEFSVYGPSRNYGIMSDTTYGNIVNQPIQVSQPNNVVFVSIPDGNGGWFIGGAFTQIGDSARQRVAHINAQGRVSAWKVKNCNSNVRALQIDGNSLYIGGDFTQLGDSTRNRIAEVDLTTGSVTSKFNIGGLNGTVWSFAKTATNLYVGGSFNTYGSSRSYGTILDTVLGNLINTNYPQANSTVWASVADGNGGWFIGGDFSQVGDSARQRIAHINSQGKVSAWKVKNCNNAVRSLEIEGNSLYAGGYFSIVGDSTRNRIVEINATTGEVTSKFNTGGFDGVVLSLTKNNKNIYAGGEFNYYGPSRNYGIMIDTAYGNIVNQPIQVSQPNSTVFVSIPDGNGGWFIGGQFTQVGDSIRQRVAHINAQGRVSAWKVKNCNNNVRALYLDGNSLYIGGDFTTVSDSTRNRIAEVDATTGVLLSKFKYRNFNNTVYDFEKGPNVLYVGGNFTRYTNNKTYAAVTDIDGLVNPIFPKANGSVRKVIADGNGGWYIVGTFTMVGDSVRNRAAQINSLGQVTSWNPNSNGTIQSITVYNNSVYLGGDFTTISGQTRNRIAEVNNTTGAPTSWDANANNSVTILKVINGALYAGGDFTNIGGQNRNRLASLDLSSAAASAWDPNVNSTVWEMEVVNNTLFIGGSFTSVSGTSKLRGASINLNTGTLNSWNINANNTIRSLKFVGNRMLIGGDFNYIGNSSQQRNYITAADTSIGNIITTFNPVANTSVYSMELFDNRLLVGGNFTVIGGNSTQSYVALLDTLTGNSISTWRSTANALVRSISISGGKAFIGGDFAELDDDRIRNYAVGIDLTTQRPKPWNPNPSSTVYALHLYQDSILMGGNFNSINGVARNFITKLDTINGLTSSWNAGLNSQVLSMGLINNKLYIGGSFTTAGGQTRNRAAAFDLTTGTVTSFNPNLNSNVWAIKPIGGKVFIGGDFGTVNNKNKSYIVSVDPDLGNIDPSWDINANSNVFSISNQGAYMYIGNQATFNKDRFKVAAFDKVTGLLTSFNPSLNANVWAMAMSNGGDSLYLAGEFSNVNNMINGPAVNRNYLAKVDATFGKASSWNPTGFNSWIRSLAISGNKLYVGGHFTTASGQTRNRMMAFDTLTGTITSFNPNLNAVVSDILPVGNSIVFGGDFTMMGSLQRRYVASVDRETGLPTKWETSTNGSVLALQLQGSQLYIGGSCSQIGFRDRGYAASFSLNNGQILSWNPGANGTVYAIQQYKDSLILGGNFNNVNGVSRNYITKVDTVNGLMSSWNVSLNNQVLSMGLSNDKLYIGGSFSTAGGQTRNRAAAFNLTTGTVTPFNPNLNSNVWAIQQIGSKVYLGGEFGTVGNKNKAYLVALDSSLGVQDPTWDIYTNSTVFTITGQGANMYIGNQATFNKDRYRVAAFDKTTGILTPFNPSTNGTVWSMAMSNGGDSLYIAGEYGNINNTTQGPAVNRNYLAKVDATYGKVSSWNPAGFNNWIRSLAISGNKLYVGGHFTTSSGQPRNRMMAFDTLTGTITSFNPNLNAVVSEILPVGNSIVFGGDFTMMGSLPRRYVASVDRETGLPTKWETSTNGSVYALQLQGSQLYIGGSCSQIGYRERGYAAAFSLNNGQILSWNPGANSTVYALQQYKDSLLLGGSFNSVNGVSRNYIAKVDTVNGLMSSWNAGLNNQVLSMGLSNDKLYIGGSFTTAGGQTRNRAAAFDLTANTITAFNPNLNSTVWSIKQVGSKVFLGGDFTTLASKNKPYLAAVDSAIGTQDLTWDIYSNTSVYNITSQGAYLYIGNQATFYKDRYRVAAFDKTTGVLTPFNPSTNGTVWAMAMSNGGDSLYLAGDFGNINNTQGPVVNRNFLAKVDATYGKVSSWNPTGFNNVLRSLAISGNKLYVGGHFTTASGQTRNRMMAFDTLTGAITSFNPNLNGGVLSIMPVGNSLIIGGEFSMMGSLPRRYIASVDRETGLPTKWETSANGVVYTIQQKGSQLFAGGSCSQIGYRERNYAAAFKLTTGLMTNWNPGFNSTVYTMITSGDSIYVGGSFNNVSGISRNYIGKFDAENGYYSSWNPNANNQILGMALAGGKIYLGGSFGVIGGKTRNRIASVDTLTGVTTDWNPNANSTVWGLLPVGDKIYAVGDFTQIGTKNRQYIAELDTIVANSSNTNTTGWDASANSGIYTIKGYGSNICVGGSYNNIGSPNRNRLAAINMVTGDLLGFDPVVNGTVRSIIVEDGKLYIGGSFNNINGVSRTYLSRFDIASGKLDTWNPALNNAVYSMAKNNNTLYVGGSFTTVNATTRNRIASLDTSGTLNSWDPSANNIVQSIVLNAGNIYVGGSFTSIGGQTRNRIASFDNAGSITTWNPNANSEVRSIMINQGRLYAGGWFTNIGGVSRNYLASFDLANGNVNTWNPNPNGPVYTSVADRNLVYIGGEFGAVNGIGRSYFASIDTNGTGSVTSWTPNPNCYVYTIVPKGDTIISGGCYSYIANASATNLSAISRYALTVTGANKAGVCAGDNVKVYYTITPSLAAGNVFTLELSDSSGSFANPIAIGTLTSSVSDTITGVIPNSITKFSYLYKLRIRSSGTAVEPTAWSSNFTINPIATSSFTVNKALQCLGSNSYVFTNTSTPITNNFTWLFGDNTTSSAINPTKQYTSAGTFQVKLVSGGTYCRDTGVVNISIDSTVANFVPNRYAQCEDSATFTFTNTTSPSVTGKTFKWNFGTGVGDTAVTTNAQKTYATIGEYTVKLVVTSSSGCKDSVTKKVNLYPFPSAPVSADVTRCGTGTVTLNATVPTGFVAKWYNTPTGGSPIATGNTFVTPNISTTTNYYVETQYNLATLPGDTVSSARMLVGLRKLKSTYTGNAVKLRRSSDNATQQFGFAGNELDTVAIKTWLGAATPYVEVIYDQSGYGNNMSQTNTGNQPVLVFSGYNGKPTVRFTTNHFMINNTNFPAPFTTIGIAKLNGGSDQRVFSAISNNWLLGYHSPGRQMAYYEGWVVGNSVTTNLNSPYIYTGMGTGLSSYFYENSLLLGNNANGVQGPNGPQFNGYGNGLNQTSNVDIFEYMVTNNTIDSNTRRVVENNIASRYNVSITPAAVPITSTVTCPSNRINVKAIVGGTAMQLPDSVFGCGDSVLVDAGAGFSTYTWSGGDTTRTKWVKSTGWVACSVVGGSCGAAVQVDSAYVLLNNNKIIQNDTTICAGLPIVLSSTATTSFNPTVNVGNVCGTAAENGTVTLTAPGGHVFTSINFASYGTPTGSCGSFAINPSCHATNSIQIVQALCIGKSTCNIPANNTVFGDPCSGTGKQLFVQATYGNIPRNNLLRNTANNGVATITEYSAAGGASTYSSIGSTCNDSWSAYGTLCDEGVAQNSSDSSYKSNNNSGATWNNATGGYGRLVIDLGSVKTFNAMSVFQMFSDGKTSHVSLFYNTNTGATAPSSTATGWNQLVNQAPVGAGTQNGNMVTSPLKSVFSSVSARYIMIHAYNDGTYGSNGYIELRAVKLFSSGIATSNAKVLWSTNDTTSSITVTPTTSTTYYCTTTVNGRSCIDSVRITTIVKPTATATPAGPTTFATGGSVVINANTGTGFTYKWLNNNVIIPTATSASYTATAAGSYRVLITNATGCSDTSSAVVVTISACSPATSSAATATTFCSGGSVILNAATGTGYTYQWLNNNVPIATATNQAYTATATGNYRVIITSGACVDTATAIVVTVNAIPTVTATTPANRCGAGTVTLKATASAGTINWYAAATGGTSLATDTSFTTPSISATTTYYVDATNNGCTTATRTSVVATVNAIPTVTATTPAAICGTGTATLGATASAGTLNWYAAATGGTSLATGTSFTTPSISTTTTYYVDATNNGCTTATRTSVVATVNAIPTVTATTPAAICGTGTATLGATASAGTINWYAAATGGTSLATDTSFTTPSISATTTYYVDATNNGCTTATRTAVIATVNTIPTVTATTPATICGTGTATLGATASAGTLNWYAAATGGTSLATGTSFTTPSISATTTYYVDATNNGCTTATRTAVIATVNPNLTASVSVSASSTSICGSTPITFTATPINGGTTPTYQWKKNGVNVGTSSDTYVLNGAVNGDSIYVVLTSNATPCLVNVTSNSNGIKLTSSTVTPSVAVVATPGTTICAGTSVTFTATATNGGTTPAYQWIKNGVNVGTNSNVFTTSSLLTNDTIKVVLTSNANCVSTTTATSNNSVMTVNAIPTVTATTPAARCGTGTVTLGATASAGTLNWYAAATGGTSLATGTSFTTPSISATTTYYVDATNNGCATATRTAVIATVNTIPTVTATTPATICGTGTATLGATASAGTLNWYAAATGGTSLDTGTSFTTPSISATTTYYVDATNNGCTTATRTAVIATVNTIPTVTATTPATICGTGTATLGATASAGTLNWYAAATGGTSLDTGASFTTPSISATTTYYVDATNNGCTTATRTAVIATVNPNLTASVSVSASSTSICGSTPITFTATATNGGTTPTYQWKKNGVNVGTSSDTYVLNGAVNGDSVYVVLTSNATPCLVNVTSNSNGIKLTSSTVTPSVAVVASPGTTICAGTSVTFTATATNGGTTPAYQWMKNGVNIGTNSDVFTTSSLLNDDSITVTMTSNATCLSTTTATSSVLVINVNAKPVTSLIAGATSVHKDTLETYSVINTIGSVYNWLITGGVQLSGGTTNSIVVRWDSSYTSGTVKVVETSLLGCLGDTVTKNIISIVPVKLISFDAKRNKTKAEITWITASELNNKGFDVERSTDNKNFEYLGSVKGHGTTLLVNNYNYNDDITALLNIGLEFVYYRLKQVDYNGKYEYTPTRAVSLNDFAGIDLQVNPNPSKGTFAITVNSTESVVTNFNIYDNLGMLIWSKEITLQPGDNNIPVSIEVAQGIYTVVMNNSLTNQTARIIIK